MEMFHVEPPEKPQIRNLFMSFDLFGREARNLAEGTQIHAGPQPFQDPAPPLRLRPAHDPPRPRA